MVEQKSIAGFYSWGDERFPDFCIELRPDNTCSYCKSPDEDLDRPMTPMGTSFNGNGTYEVVGDSVRISGKGKGYDFGWLYPTSSAAIEGGAKDEDHDFTRTIADLESHRMGDAEGQINKHFDKLT